MAKFRVEYYGSVEIEADSAFEAEVQATSECGLDNCRAESLDEEGNEENDEQS